MSDKQQFYRLTAFGGERGMGLHRDEGHGFIENRGSVGTGF